jgi:serine/threonine protein phosphatase PrpC
MGDLEGVDRNTVPLKLQEGDKLLLLSDGVFSTLTEEEICQCLTDDPGHSARALAERVRECQKPHQDNYTAVIYAHGS